MTFHITLEKERRDVSTWMKKERAFEEKDRKEAWDEGVAKWRAETQSPVDKMRGLS